MLFDGQLSIGDILIAAGVIGGFVRQSIQYRERFNAHKIASEDRDARHEERISRLDDRLDRKVSDLESKLHPTQADVKVLNAKLEALGGHLQNVSNKMDLVVTMLSGGSHSLKKGRDK